MSRNARWKLAAAVCVLMMTGALFTASLAQAAKYVIKFSHGMPQKMESDQHALAVVFKDIVEAGSRGDIEVRILGANTGGNERQQLERVQTGILQMCNVSEGTQHLFFKPALVLGTPFLFSSSAVAWEVMDGPFGKKYGEAFLKATGVRVLGHTESGFRSLFNGTRIVRTPSDLKGLKIRTMENPAHMAMMKGLGANPVPIAWTEVYTSLQQKVVDGMENPPGLFFLMKFYEHQKYLTVNRHLYSLHTTMVNERFFQSLPKKYQELVTEAARAGTVVGRGVGYIAEMNAIGNLKKKGIKVYYPTAEEYAQFRNLGRPPAEKYIRSRVGDEWMDAVLKGVADAEAKIRGR
ncbi:MAG: TRAP transporter substrate-binding protein DctP [Nitrospinota bacterium]